MKYHGWVTTQEASRPGTEPAMQHLEWRICMRDTNNEEQYKIFESLHIMREWKECMT